MIDLHSHTTYSDGSYSVLELLEEAQKTKLSLLSITDHNTIQAHFDLQDSRLRKKFDGKIITGIEITTTYKGEIIEVLGYGFDIDIMQNLLEPNVLSFKDKQLKEYELIKEQYHKIGLTFDINNIKFDPNTESSRSAWVKEIKKYPENYKFFLNEDDIKTNAGFTRNEVYNPKSHLYVDESPLFPSLEKTIEIIHESGGLAFLAHPFAYSPNIPNDISNIINNYKLDGLECFYTTFTKEQTMYLCNLCKENHLFKSGGSDFHGSRKEGHHLGFGNGDLKIDETIVDDWISKI